MVVDKTFKAVGLAACLWAVFVMSGGHWVALQSIAWGRMLAHFSQQDSLGAAIAKTFSGKYPCSLCLKVRDGAQQEKQHEDKLPWIKTEKLPEAVWQLSCVTAPRVPTAAHVEQPFVPMLHANFIDSPPTPPPRAS